MTTRIHKYVLPMKFGIHKIQAMHGAKIMCVKNQYDMLAIYV